MVAMEASVVVAVVSLGEEPPPSPPQTHAAPHGRLM